MNAPIIDFQHCTKKFWRKVAVSNLSLQVEPGQVYGLVGNNGAGKTTSIKMMLGFYPPSEGSIRVFGLDPQKQDIEIKSRIGYVSENREMYEWMKVSEIIWFVKQFYAKWNDALIEKLLTIMELPPHTKIKHLSRGMRAKLSLILAMGHEPELLILDEPSSGLDPIVRREILEQIIGVIQNAGKSVFFSSHLLDEVERVSDRVGIICESELISDTHLDELKNKIKKIRVAWNGSEPDRNSFSSVHILERSGREETYISFDYKEDLLNQFKQCNPITVTAETLTLEEIFVHMVQYKKKGSLETKKIDFTLLK